MLSLNFNLELPPFEKAIQLYGDRAGGQGNFEFAGLADLKESKVVLLKGNTKSLEQPADWRRFLRLTNLAQRLSKPLLLWNLPLIHITTTQHTISLTLGSAIQNTKMQLLKLPQPIITVFDGNYNWSDIIAKELGWVDGGVVVKPKKEVLSTFPNLEKQNLKIVCEKSDISKQILKLLQEVSQVNSEELIANRLGSFPLPTKIQS